MFRHAHLCFFFSVAYKYNGTGEITLLSTNRATIMCEQHVHAYMFVFLREYCLCMDIEKKTTKK